jgi:adenylosuccinate synthase
MTKLDVLDGLTSLKICTGYRIGDRVVDILPYGADSIASCVPVFEELPGWQESTLGIKEFAALPLNAQRYLSRIEALVGTKIALVSTGPDRTETILVQHPFAS